MVNLNNMIYTSYFGKRDIPYPTISVAGKCPDWYKGPQLKKLAPKYDFFKLYKDGEIDDAEYTRRYKKEVLDTLDPKQIVSEIYMYGQNINVVLLCYEKPGDFCHRHLIAEWLSPYDGEVKEYEKETDN